MSKIGLQLPIKFLKYFSNLLDILISNQRTVTCIEIFALTNCSRVRTFGNEVNVLSGLS